MPRRLEGWRALAATLAICLVVTGSAMAAPADGRDQEAGDAVAELLIRQGRSEPGLVFAVSIDGEIVAEAAAGLASLELGVPLAADSVFNAGSVAKWLTAYAVLRLAEAGRLSLAAPLERYLDDLPQRARPITVAQLLQHTSGLKDYWALSALAGQHGGDRRSQAAAVAMIRRQDDLNFPPGERHLYSNSGYILLAEIVTAVTGEPYADWMHRTVFAPLGMRSSRMQDNPLQIVPGLAPSYRRLGDEGEARESFARETLNSGVIGSGNLLTTAADLLRWAHYLQRARIDGVPALERLSRQPELTGQPPPGYGFGVSVGSHRGHRALHHGGANAGYRAHLLLLPDIGIAVAVLSNAGHLDAEAIARLLADWALRRIGESVPDEADELTEGMLALAPPGGQDAYVGMYLLENGVLLRVREVSGRLVMLITGSPHALSWDGGHGYRLPGSQGRLEFSLDAETQASAVTLVLPQARLRGERREALVLEPRQLRALEGDYLSRSLAAVVRLARDDAGGLRLEQPSGGRLTLKPVAPGVFLEWDSADFLVSFDQDRRGRTTGFRMSLERARDVRFERL
ncbi:MAG: serine hydrolase domain-containing protein [Pseudomonadales bacterium]